MSAYANDLRVRIGLYEAFVTGRDGPMYIFAGNSRDDWVVAPADTSTLLKDADARHDLAAIADIVARYPHYGSFDEAICSVIGDPQ